MGCALILAAAGLAGKNITEAQRAEKLSARSAQELEALILAQADIEEDLSARALIPEVSSEPELGGSMPTVKIYSREYIGILSLPSLELELPVISQWSDENLKAAPCRFYGSVYSDDLVIAGHNFHAHFGRLKTLSPGDRLSFTDVNGAVYDYEVTAIETLDPSQVEEMCSGVSELTLFTCTADGDDRLTIRCSLI